MEGPESNEGFYKGGCTLVIVAEPYVGGCGVHLDVKWCSGEGTPVVVVLLFPDQTFFSGGGEGTGFLGHPCACHWLLQPYDCYTDFGVHTSQS